MENNNNAGNATDTRAMALAINKGIPPGRALEIQRRGEQSVFYREEAKKAISYIIDSNFDRDTLSVTLDMFVDKLIKSVKEQVTAELLAENWRVS